VGNGAVMSISRGPSGSTTGAALLRRPRLVDDALAQTGAVLVEAGGGFGKSVLVDQMAGAVPEGIRLALPRDPVDTDLLRALLDDALNSGPDDAPATGRDPDVAEIAARGLLTVDNVSSLSDEAATWLADLVREASPAVPVVLSGRSMPSPFTALEIEGWAGRIDADDLRLTPDETRELVKLRLGDADGERIWSPLHQFAGGWVGLLALVVRRLERSTDRAAAAADILRHPAVLGQIVDHYASGLHEDDRRVFVQLAHLPMVSERIADALGSRGLLRRLSHAGIPFTQGPDGWWRLPRTITDHVTGHAPLDAETAVQVAPLFAADTAELTAAEVLLAAGDPAAAAALVAHMPTERIDAQKPHNFVRLVRQLGAAADAAPRCLLHLARVHGNAGRLEEEREVIDRALALVRERGVRDELAYEAEAEALFHRALANDELAVGEIEALLQDAPAGSRGRARLLEALGVAFSEAPDEPSLRRAEDVMRRAAMLWTDLGEPSRAASVQRGLAVRVLAALGKHRDGVRLLRTLRETSGTSYDRMLCLVFEARALALAGDDDDVTAVMEEAGSLAEFLGIDWVEGHVAWTNVLVTANAGAAPLVRTALAQAESSLGQLADDVGGVLFLCEAADACAAVGLEDDAARLLAAAVARRDEDPVTVAFTEAGLAARQGQPGAGEELARLLAAGQVPPGLRWKAELLRGLVPHPADDGLSARSSLERALEQATAIGQPDVVDRRERRVLDTLRLAATEAEAEAARARALADGSGAGTGTDAGAGPGHHTAAGGGTAATTYEVSLLGVFRIHCAGEAVAAPAGRMADLVKRVAVAGGRAPVEGVVESLWPDEPPGVAQRRLKNVLSRSRRAFGPLLVRDGPHLRLGDCTVDLVQFEQAAGQVALARGDDRVDRARAALAHFAGPLLPDDIYDDWIEQRRETVRRRALGLVDIVLTGDLAAGDLDGALAVLQVAAEHDPNDQERLLRVARALADAGRDLEALGLVRQVIAAAHGPGTTPAAEWAELERTIAARS